MLVIQEFPEGNGDIEWHLAASCKCLFYDNGFLHLHTTYIGCMIVLGVDKYDNSRSERLR